MSNESVSLPGYFHKSSSKLSLGSGSIREVFPRGRTLSWVSSRRSSPVSSPLRSELIPRGAFAKVCHVLPFFCQPEDMSRGKPDMGWYPRWICQQYSATPSNLLSVLPGGDEEGRAEAFMQMWQELGTFLSSHPATSIDDTLRHLQNAGLVDRQTENASAGPARSLVFTVIGWQTMLFRGDCGSCPSTSFAIADEMSGHKGRVHLRLKYPQTCCRDPLNKCLLSFGVLLPPKNYDLAESAEHRNAFAEYKDIDSSSFNAYLLVNVGRLELKWTDCLACHLELDLVARCVYLFRYPSFCVSSKAISQKEWNMAGPIYACCQQGSGSAIWAKHDEVSDLLDEVIMSYRLLFGMNKPSRKLFRGLEPFVGAAAEMQDKLLTELCGRKQCDTRLPQPARKTWDLKHDFPVLRSRLSTLAYELSIRKPRTWTELWKDKRDSAQWATFWTLIIFGIVSLLLSAIQVILQAIQVATQK